jgi:hypothetical protein
MPGMNREIITVHHGVDDRLDIREVKTRINPLGILVESKRDDVDVASALSVAE